MPEEMSDDETDVILTKLPHAFSLSLSKFSKLYMLPKTENSESYSPIII